MQPIQSLNPIFTKLLDSLSDPDNIVYRKYPLYTSADDPLPNYQEESVTISAEDIVQAQEDQRHNPGGWPHKNAVPMMMLGTGPVPIFRVSS